jgi:hypothetical protein
MSHNDNDDLPDDVKKFLEEDCISGEYTAVTILVKTDVVNDLMDHLSGFMGQTVSILDGSDEIHYTEGARPGKKETVQ